MKREVWPQRHEHGRIPHKAVGRSQGNIDITQDTTEKTTNLEKFWERHRTDSLPQSLTCWPWPCSLQNCEKISLMFKAPSQELQISVTFNLKFSMIQLWMAYIKLKYVSAWSQIKVVTIITASEFFAAQRLTRPLHKNNLWDLSHCVFILDLVFSACIWSCVCVCVWLWYIYICMYVYVG